MYTESLQRPRLLHLRGKTMRAKQIDIDPATSDPDGLADGNSSAGATLTLDGALTSGGAFTSADGLGRQLSITDLGADDQTGATYTITGTDADNRAQTEDRAGPGASATVTSVKFFKTVSSVAIASPAAGSTVDMGTTTGGVFASKTIVLDHYADEAAIAQAVVTGTINFDIETTLQNVLEAQTGVFAINDQSDISWIDDANWTAVTANAASALATKGIRAMRIVGNSYTDGAELQLMLTQPR